MSKIELHIRPSDCDSFGHVNNGVYVSFLQYTLAKQLSEVGLANEWRPDSEYTWTLKTLEIEYRHAAMFADHVTAGIGLVHADALCPVFGIELTRTSPTSGNYQQEEESILRARATWQRISRKTGEGTHLPDKVLMELPRDSVTLPRPFTMPQNPQGIQKYHWTHKIMRSEVNDYGEAHPQAIYHWLEEGVFDATAQAGWTPERRLAAGIVILQLRHDTEFFASPDVGDSIQITSCLIQARRFRGTWLQEIYRYPQKELLVRDYSTGIFLDLTGRPSSPPPEMMHDIQHRSCSS